MKKITYTLLILALAFVIHQYTKLIPTEHNKNIFKMVKTAESVAYSADELAFPMYFLDVNGSLLFTYPGTCEKELFNRFSETEKGLDCGKQYFDKLNSVKTYEELRKKEEI